MIFFSSIFEIIEKKLNDSLKRILSTQQMFLNFMIFLHEKLTRIYTVYAAQKLYVIVLLKFEYFLRFKNLKTNKQSF